MNIPLVIETHDILTTIVLSFILIGLIGGGVIFYKLFYAFLSKLDGVNKVYTKSNMRVTVPYIVAIDKILVELKYELNSADVFIGRFHNGGDYANGTPMEKFSITHGKASPNIKALQPRFYNIFCSHWPVVIEYLIVFNEYVCYNFDECSDTNFVKDMNEAGFKSVYIFLICQNDAAQTPEGFVTVAFTDQRHLPTETKDRIKSDIPTLLSLMNLTPFKKEIR
jgi:hypothetical protein